MKKHKKLIIILGSIISFVLILIAVFGIYFGNYYHAVNVDEYLKSNEEVLVTNDEYISFIPQDEEIKGGIIFYQGAKVEYTAYSKLMYELALEGYAAFIVKMPFNFAIFGVNKADEIINDYDIDNWYLMGHSLGGAMASSYVSQNLDVIDGIILLASYSTEDLTKTRVLSIYGSNDLVLNIDKYNEYKCNLPQDYIELVIEGGNHAYFASYGEQAGDGLATITSEEQITITVEAILEFII